MTTRVAAQITGRVQGVGFRPAVYRYATQLGLRGYVRNDPAGVVLEVEGEPLQVGTFFERLARQPPHQAVIAAIRTETLSARGYDRFSVLESDAAGDPSFAIPPDLATCDDCLRELLDPADRRHEYPFINCTNCGPRFTIIRDLPYDRANTSMRGFAMCSPCAGEYHDPADRRFHAQPDACAECGPSLSLREDEAPAEPQIEGHGSSSGEMIQRVVSLLRAGRIVAVKSLGGYHLACDALNPDAVARLRTRKHRPHKPFAVMFRDLETLEQHCVVSQSEKAELLSPARPIVILRHLDTQAIGHLSALSPDSDTLGAFLPYTPLHHLLLRPFTALVMTSGNLVDEPIVSDERELPILLGPIADTALLHDRPVVHKCDDSVLQLVGGQRQFLRRARGYVPNPIPFAPTSPHLLAVGGELKNTFCLARDGWAFLSQHLGDLQDRRTYEHFEREIGEWQRLMRVAPAVIAHDLHPDYLSTRWAGEQGRRAKNEGRPLRLIGVQHHHAHIASVLAEHRLAGPVIGVALDGTGYGPDGTVWGGEFLLATRTGFERIARFKPYRLPGGDRAVQEPWRMALSVALAEGEESRVVAALDGRRENAEAIIGMVRTGLNSPLTSSAGRLFDAVAALLRLCDSVSYEAQAAIRLEHAADPRITDAYRFALRTESAPWTLDFGDAIRRVIHDHDRGTERGVIAARFHHTVADAVVAVCRRVRQERGLQPVALSGGVWQNAWLLGRATRQLREQGFAVYINQVVPPNDGGLALGQAAVATARDAGGVAASSTDASRREQPCV